MPVELLTPVQWTMAPAPAPTPLLNRERPLALPRKRNIVIQLLAGAAFGVALNTFGRRISIGLFDFPAATMAFLAAMFLGVLIHELGHVAAGILAGFEFSQLLVGPCLLCRESGGHKLRFVPKRILVLGGHTVMFPRSTANLRRDFAVFVAGGPIATTLSFLVLAVIPVGSIWWGVLLANLLLAVFCWTPMAIAGQMTDGRHLLTLARGGPSGELFAAILYLLAIDSRGAAPRDWPPEIVERLAAEAPGRGYNEHAATMLYIHRADVGDSVAMADALEKVLANSSRMAAAARRMYLAEAAYFMAIHRHEAAVAEAWLADARKVKGGVALKDWDASASSAVSFARGDYQEARRLANLSIARLDRMSRVRGSVVAARRRLTALLESLPEANMAQPSSLI